ncbi:MAG: response regulator transcription factor [Bacillota bacterium]
MAGRILVVDDEVAITKLVAYHLEREGFEVVSRYDGESAYNEIRSADFDLVVLDLMLPGMSGWDVLRLCRNAGKRFPVILLTARADEVDKVAGLELGADDYVTKPFSPRELVARVRAHLRRREELAGNEVGTSRLTVGALVLDEGTRDVAVARTLLALTAKEFDLLAYMARRPGRTFTRENLLESVWGYEFAGDTRTVDVHVSRLRQKLEPFSAQNHVPTIETMRGVGYRLVLPDGGGRPS